MERIKNKGFTLIELIATLAIFSIVLAAVFTVLESGNSIYINGIRKDNVQASARQASTVLSQSIRNARVVILADSNPRFDSVELHLDASIGEKKLLYIEGNDNKRYLYFLKVVNEKKELRRVKFSDSGYENYEIADPLIEQRITDADKTLFNSDSNKHNKISLSKSNLSSRIDTDSIIDFNSKYNVIDSANNFYYILYENYGDRSYLWAKKISDGLDYRIKLKALENTDYDIEAEDTITGNIDSVDIFSDVTIADKSISVTKQNIYKLNIHVKTKDKDKTKEINTSSFILNYRGGV